MARGVLRRQAHRVGRSPESQGRVDNQQSRVLLQHHATGALVTGQRHAQVLGDAPRCGEPSELWPRTVFVEDADPSRFGTGQVQCRVVKGLKDPGGTPGHAQDEVGKRVFLGFPARRCSSGRKFFPADPCATRRWRHGWLARPPVLRSRRGGRGASDAPVRRCRTDNSRECTCQRARAAVADLVGYLLERPTLPQ